MSCDTMYLISYTCGTTHNVLIVDIDVLIQHVNANTDADASTHDDTITKKSASKMATRCRLALIP